jgi:hypothetical protein
MLATAIPPDQWENFAGRFSRQHHGWLVTVEVTDSRLLDVDPRKAEVQSRLLVRDQPLQEIALDGPGKAGGFRVVVGAEPDHWMHRVGLPLEVRFETTDDGAHQGVRFDCADGTTTRVRFRTAAHPEAIDGIAESEW